MDPSIFSFVSSFFEISDSQGDISGNDIVFPQTSKLHLLYVPSVHTNPRMNQPNNNSSNSSNTPPTRIKQSHSRQLLLTNYNSTAHTSEEPSFLGKMVYRSWGLTLVLLALLHAGLPRQWGSLHGDLLHDVGIISGGGLFVEAFSPPTAVLRFHSSQQQQPTHASLSTSSSSRTSQSSWTTSTINERRYSRSNAANGDSSEVEDLPPANANGAPSANGAKTTNTPPPPEDMSKQQYLNIAREAYTKYFTGSIDEGGYLNKALAAWDAAAAAGGVGDEDGVPMEENGMSGGGIANGVGDGGRSAKEGRTDVSNGRLNEDKFASANRQQQREQGMFFLAQQPPDASSSSSSGNTNPLGVATQASLSNKSTGVSSSVPSDKPNVPPLNNSLGNSPKQSTNTSWSNEQQSNTSPQRSTTQPNTPPPQQQQQQQQSSSPPKKNPKDIGTVFSSILSGFTSSSNSFFPGLNVAKGGSAGVGGVTGSVNGSEKDGIGRGGGGSSATGPSAQGDANNFLSGLGDSLLGRSTKRLDPSREDEETGACGTDTIGEDEADVPYGLRVGKYQSEIKQSTPLKGYPILNDKATVVSSTLAGKKQSRSEESSMPYGLRKEKVPKMPTLRSPVQPLKGATTNPKSPPTIPLGETMSKSTADEQSAIPKEKLPKIPALRSPVQPLKGATILPKSPPSFSSVKMMAKATLDVQINKPSLLSKAPVPTQQSSDSSDVTAKDTGDAKSNAVKGFVSMLKSEKFSGFATKGKVSKMESSPKSSLKGAADDSVGPLKIGASFPNKIAEKANASFSFDQAKKIGVSPQSSKVGEKARVSFPTASAEKNEVASYPGVGEKKMAMDGMPKSPLKGAIGASSIAGASSPKTVTIPKKANVSFPAKRIGVLPSAGEKKPSFPSPKTISSIGDSIEADNDLEAEESWIAEQNRLVEERRAARENAELSDNTDTAVFDIDQAATEAEESDACLAEERRTARDATESPDIADADPNNDVVYDLDQAAKDSKESEAWVAQQNRLVVERRAVRAALEERQSMRTKVEGGMQPKGGSVLKGAAFVSPLNKSPNTTKESSVGGAALGIGFMKAKLGGSPPMAGTIDSAFKPGLKGGKSAVGTRKGFENGPVIFKSGSVTAESAPFLSGLNKSPIPDERTSTTKQTANVVAKSPPFLSSFNKSSPTTKAMPRTVAKGPATIPRINEESPKSVTPFSKTTSKGAVKGPAFLPGPKAKTFGGKTPTLQSEQPMNDAEEINDEEYDSLDGKSRRAESGAASITLEDNFSVMDQGPAISRDFASPSIDLASILKDVDESSLPLLHIGSRVHANEKGTTHQGYLILSNDNPSSSIRDGSPYNVLPCVAKRPWTMSELKTNVPYQAMGLDQIDPPSDDYELQMNTQHIQRYFEVEYHCFQKAEETKKLIQRRQRQAQEDEARGNDSSSKEEQYAEKSAVVNVVPNFLGIYKDDGSGGESEDEDVWGKSLNNGREWMVYSGGLEGTEFTLDQNIQHDEHPHHLFKVQQAMNLPDSHDFGDVIDAILRSLLENLVFLTSCNIVHRKSKSCCSIFFCVATLSIALHVLNFLLCNPVKLHNLLCDSENQRIQLINFGDAVDLDPKDEKRIGLDNPSSDPDAPGALANTLLFDAYSTAVVVCQLLFNLMDTSSVSFQRQLKDVGYDLDGYLRKQLKNVPGVNDASEIPALKYLSERRGLYGLLKRMLQPNPLKRKLAIDLLKQFDEIIGLRDGRVEWSDELIAKIAVEESYLEKLIDVSGQYFDVLAENEEDDTPITLNGQGSTKRKLKQTLASLASSVTIDDTSLSQETTVDTARGGEKAAVINGGQASTKVTRKQKLPEESYFDITRTNVAPKSPSRSSLLTSLLTARPRVTASSTAPPKELQNAQFFDITRVSLGDANPNPKMLQQSMVLARAQMPREESTATFTVLEPSDTPPISSKTKEDEELDLAMDKSLQELERWLLSYLPRLQKQDIASYSKCLISDGFDSTDMLKELVDDDLTFMKKGHRRLVFHFHCNAMYLKSLHSLFTCMITCLLLDEQSFGKEARGGE